MRPSLHGSKGSLRQWFKVEKIWASVFIKQNQPALHEPPLYRVNIDLVCLNLQGVTSRVLQTFRLRILKFAENLALYDVAEVLFKSWLCAPCMLFC